MPDTKPSLTPVEHAVQTMSLDQLQRKAVRLWDALCASRALGAHTQHVLGGWDECDPCQSANDHCDSSLVCDQAKAWLKEINAPWRTS